MTPALSDRIGQVIHEQGRCYIAVPWARADELHARLRRLGYASTLCLDPGPTPTSTARWRHWKSPTPSLLPPRAERGTRPHAGPGRSSGFLAAHLSPRRANRYNQHRLLSLAWKGWQRGCAMLSRPGAAPTGAQAAWAAKACHPLEPASFRLDSVKTRHPETRP